MLILISSLKLVVEIALLALLGQWLVGVFAGAGRDRNLVYQVFDILTRPLVRAVRFISPRMVLDRHLPLAAGALLATTWVAVTLAKIGWCLRIGVEQCR